MNGPLVVKIGGSTLGAADTTYADIAALAAGGDIPVVVHGGGAEATRWLEAMAIPSRFERGLRVTDEKALPVIVGVFAGIVNTRIVAAINAAGASAIGLSGADARLVECEIRRHELGFVGEPVRVNARAIEAIRGAGFVPVICSIGVVPGDRHDQPVNVNADTVAGHIAAALRARRAVFLTDVEGVRGADGALLPELDAAAAEALIAEGTIAGGMIPKVRACLEAAQLGVPAQVVDGRLPGVLRDLDGRGTLIRPAG